MTLNRALEAVLSLRGLNSLPFVHFLNDVWVSPTQREKPFYGKKSVERVFFFFRGGGGGGGGGGGTESLKVPRYTIALFYLLKQNRFIVPVEIHKSYAGENIYRQDPKFLDRSSGQTVQTEINLKLRSTCSIGISLIRVDTVAICLHIAVEPQKQADYSRARAGCACSKYGMDFFFFFFFCVCGGVSF